MIVATEIDQDEIHTGFPALFQCVQKAGGTHRGRTFTSSGRIGFVPRPFCGCRRGRHERAMRSGQSTTTLRDITMMESNNSLPAHGQSKGFEVLSNERSQRCMQNFTFAQSLVGMSPPAKYIEVANQTFEVSTRWNERHSSTLIGRFLTNNFLRVKGKNVTPSR